MGGREGGKGARAAATGFYPPPGARAPGLTPRASRASPPPPQPPPLLAPRPAPGAHAHAQPGPAPPPARARACVRGPPAPPRAASRARLARPQAPAACRPAAQTQKLRGGRGRADGGGARRGQVTRGGRERRRLVAILGGRRLMAGPCEGGARAAEGGRGPSPRRPPCRAGRPRGSGHCSWGVALERSRADLGVPRGAPLGAAGSHDVGCEGRSEAAPRAPEEPPHLPWGGGRCAAGEARGGGGTRSHVGSAPGREGQWSPDAGGSRSLTPELNSVDVECAPWKLSHARRCRREWIRASPGGGAGVNQHQGL